MKRKELEKIARRHGWWLKRHGGGHDIWTNGLISEPIPRHPEINERLAKKIAKKMRTYPVEED